MIVVGATAVAGAVTVAVDWNTLLASHNEDREFDAISSFVPSIPQGHSTLSPARKQPTRFEDYQIGDTIYEQKRENELMLSSRARTYALHPACTVNKH